MGIHCVDCVKTARAAAPRVRSPLGLPIARGRAVVTLSLIVVNVAMFVLGPVLWGEDWAFRLGLKPLIWMDEPSTVVTSAFTHFGTFHLLLNMFVLYQFGTVVETLMGRVRFAVVYSLSILGAASAIVLLGQPRSVHAGASGAIFGVLAAFAVMSIALKRPDVNLMVMAGLWLALGFFVDVLSWEGHLGGAVVGAAVTAVLIWGGRRGRRTPRR